jgi:two-component system, NtrC family, response regulator AtoC
VVHLLLLSLRGLLTLDGGSISAAEARLDEVPVSLMVPGVSASIGVLERVIREIAPTDIPILILGESGTGKEVIASEIHRLSAQCRGPFVKFNCSSMNLDWLLGTEIQRTGSRTRQNGTVLLDEVSQLDLTKQTLLLNLLPDRERAVSGSYLTSRIISTSTRDLAEEMRGGNFRGELYFRLNGICLRIPALRQRKEDIPPLFAAFLSKHSNSLGRQQPRIKNSTMDLLLQHSWPGNVRELENVARTIVVLGDDELAVSDFALNTEAKPPANTSSNDAHTNARSLKQAAREASRKAERQLILESLERTHWNRKRSARELQISYKALLYKLKQLDLNDGKKAESKY